VLSSVRAAGEGPGPEGFIHDKEEGMNWKRFFGAALAVFVAVQAMEFVIGMFLMKSANESLEGLWRPDMMSRAWMMYLMSVLVALVFTYIFVKGREGKGIQEGVRFGIIIWLFFTVPMNHFLWVMLPIPYRIIFQWLLAGLLEMLVAGILVAVIYKPKAPAR
jgi:hypothetical protein